MSIAISGKITFTPLVEVLELLRQKKATGILTITSGSLTKSIYFKGGQIVFSASNSSRDRLGEILVRTGKLTRKNLDYATRLHKKDMGLKKLGAILVENRLLTSKDLFGGLKAQVKDIIYSLFLLEEGDYQFEERFPADIIQLQIDFQDLIIEIIQRIKQEA